MSLTDSARTANNGTLPWPQAELFGRQKEGGLESKSYIDGSASSSVRRRIEAYTLPIDLYPLVK